MADKIVGVIGTGIMGVPIARNLLRARYVVLAHNRTRAKAESLLSEERLRDSGYFDAPHVRRCWTEHAERKQDHHSKLWSILMFQQWFMDSR